MTCADLSAEPDGHAVGARRHARWVWSTSRRARREADPLMGWTSSGDTSSQLRLVLRQRGRGGRLSPRSRACPTACEEPQERQLRPKAYADNFRYDRVGRWTH